jgi:hypothetical protein
VPVFKLFAKGPGTAFQKVMTVDQVIAGVPIDNILALEASRWIESNGPGSVVELRQDNETTVVVRVTSGT